MKGLHIIIKGKVQGVFFRANAFKWSEKFHVVGWIRNKEDYVEVIVQGEDSNVLSFVEMCKQGPQLSRIEEIKIEEKEIDKRFKSFQII